MSVPSQQNITPEQSITPALIKELIVEIMTEYLDLQFKQCPIHPNQLHLVTQNDATNT